MKELGMTKSLLMALIVFSGAGLAIAGNGVGTSAFQFLQIGVGARPAALGGAFVGMSDDINALYWNPAGLAGLKRGELSMTHALWFEDISYSNIAYGQPAFGGIVGAAFNILRTGDIPTADNTGLRLGGEYSMMDMMGAISYARGWGRLALGATLKFISSRIEEESARSVAADFGLHYRIRPAGKRFDVGLSVQNAGAKAGYVSEKYSLPTIVRAGGTLELFRGFLISSELDYFERSASVHSGIEYYQVLGTAGLSLRAGYKTDTPELGALSGLTTGLGLKLGDYRLDYAWNSFADLGATHRISLGIKFGASDGDRIGSGKTPENMVTNNATGGSI